MSETPRASLRLIIFTGKGRAMWDLGRNCGGQLSTQGYSFDNTKNRTERKTPNATSDKNYSSANRHF